MVINKEAVHRMIVHSLTANKVMDAKIVKDKEAPSAQISNSLGKTLPSKSKEYDDIATAIKEKGIPLVQLESEVPGQVVIDKGDGIEILETSIQAQENDTTTKSNRKRGSEEIESQKNENDVNKKLKHEKKKKNERKNEKKRQLSADKINKNLKNADKLENDKINDKINKKQQKERDMGTEGKAAPTESNHQSNRVAFGKGDRENVKKKKKS